MEIYHVSAECFPAAKVGGLADVVGALPKYLNRLGHEAKVVIPGYATEFLRQREFVPVFDGQAKVGELRFPFEVLREKQRSLGFELFQIRIPQMFDRGQIYAYEDDTERFLAFQIAFLDWISGSGAKPDIVHCHDHHAGLIPFMMQHCKKYQRLNRIPTVLTIHNAQYQGWFAHGKMHYLPEFDKSNAGYLDWNGAINPLGCAIKCVWKLTTVSASYLDEISQNANGLESLLKHERQKSVGILNGIDTEVWNPASDELLAKNYDSKTFADGKASNKKKLCQQFNLNEKLPVFAFIGRLVYEKGADLLPEISRRILTSFKGKANVLILGSGDEAVESHLNAIAHFHRENYACFIGYNEQLAHLVYGGSDFLLMPSRVEPCGLNQMYALRYGTVPIVRRTGGLKDTVTDIGDGGFGICHDQATADDVIWSVKRALELFADNRKFTEIRRTGMQTDHSWEAVAKQYEAQYRTLKI